MNDFVTAGQLASFGAAVAAVVAIVNATLMLGGEKLHGAAKWVALVAALGVSVAARGLPTTVAEGLTLGVNAVYVFLAALGGNGAVVDGLTWRQGRVQATTETPAASGFEVRGFVGGGLDVGVTSGPERARFWRKW